MGETTSLMDATRSVGEALRPSLVLAFSIGVGFLVGRESDEPIAGLAVGIAGGSLINGILDWRAARNQIV